MNRLITAARELLNQTLDRLRRQNEATGQNSALTAESGPKATALRIARNRWFQAVVGSLLLYTLIGFLLLPALVRHFVPKLAADMLQRQAAVGEVRFNPYTFTFETKDLALREADGQPILTLGRLFLDFDPSGFISERAITVADLRLEAAAATLVRSRDGDLNVSKLAASLPKSEEPPPPTSDEPPPRVLVRHFALTETAFTFRDLTKATPLTESVEHLGLEVHDFTTLPEQQGNYTIAANLPDGGKLTWKGEVSVVPLASQGELAIESLKLATLWKFVRERLNLSEPAGDIALSAHYRFRQDKEKIDLGIEQAAFKLAGIKLAEPGGPLLDLAEIGFEKVSVDLASQSVNVPVFRIRKGRINAVMDESGQVNWQTLVKAEAPAANAKTPPASAPPAEAAPPWKLSVERFEIAELGLDYLDRSRKGDFAVAVQDFGLELGVQVEAGAGAPQAKVDGLGVHVNQVALSQPGAGAPLFSWDAFRVEGGRIDLQSQTVAFERALLQGGKTAITRDADGTLRPVDIFQAKAGSAPAEPDAPKPADSEAKPWNVSLGEFALQGFAFGFADRSFTPELAYNLDNLQLSAKHISNDGKTPVDYQAGFDVREGGKLQVVGTAAPTGEAAQAKLKIDHFDLKPLRTVVSRYAALELDSADFSTELAVDFKQAEPMPKVKVSGKADLASLKLIQVMDRKTFLGWKNLGVSGIDFSLTPDKLAVKEVRILRPDAIIHIFKDHSTNIAAIFKPQKPEPATKAPAKPEAGKAKAADKPFPVTVGRIRVDDAEIDFADESLVLPFATHITDFDGAISGLTLNPTGQATLKFDGRIDQYGEASVNGSLRPMDPKAFSHVDVAFRNVAMDSLSPYSATFAGRRIQSGKLNLELKYKIDGGKLDSENNILLDNFTLGEQVESPTALNLPLDLAVALLTDGSGKIQASVPITGDVGDPQFSYGTVVWNAFVTLITKAVTAPFNAVASMFGNSEESFDAVLFEPGRAVMLPRESEKLKKVADFLKQRPKLELTLSGRYSPKLDGEALRSLEVRRALAEKQDIELHLGEEPDQPAFADPGTERALEKLASERGGGDAVQAEYLKDTGKKPDRVGVLQGLAGKPSATPDFYEKLFKTLVEKAPLAPSELEGLAAQRGQQILDELLKKNGLDKARAQVGKPGPTDDSLEGNVPSKLELKAD
ncbi:DUF748 domain-containing protein [Methyloterricola oryzae]|uniref:DUF748 domain-containing protein n=1 Tax=Methyloterricola oryzae TaxID=1495050 RepID=UPI0005EBC870|nr:DUF748 domain-containing protein [Methyloterricola oryzae]